MMPDSSHVPYLVQVRSMDYMYGWGTTDLEKAVVLLAVHKKRASRGLWNMIHFLKQEQYSFFFLNAKKRK